VIVLHRSGAHRYAQCRCGEWTSVRASTVFFIAAIALGAIATALLAAGLHT
jgi:hypothetical protein